MVAGRVEPIVVPRPSGRQVWIRLALEHLVVTESRYAAGERGPDPHVHHLHADCFYVLEGSLTLSLRSGDRTVGPGTFVLVPPDVVHSFRNDGPGGMRFLNIHAPGVGFDRYLLDELETPFDQHPPPDDGGRDPASVLVRTAETDAVHLAGVHVGFLANAEETLDAIGLVEYTAPPGFPGPPVHVHEHTWDAYFVLEGTLAVRIGRDRLELTPGDVAVVPPGTVHGLANPTDAPTHFLDVHAPGGFERYFRELAAAVDGGQRDPEVVAQIASRYDIVSA
jgi:mannose-6-phosphate isomerase-like protein (cupin superfamily)